MSTATSSKSEDSSQGSPVTPSWFTAKGFFGTPTYREAEADEILYRVYGGVSKIKGEFFSVVDPISVTAAEHRLNIVKCGNLCLYVATFKVAEGTPMFVGRIDQSFANADLGEVGIGPVFGGDLNATQVWIEYRHVETRLELVGQPRRLVQDKTVVLPSLRAKVPS